MGLTRSAATAVVLASIALHPLAQSRPLVAPAAAAIYQRLLPQIERIKIFDHHAHPSLADDENVDAAVPPPGALPLRLRGDNPELVAAARALFAMPFADFEGPHAKWLIDKKTALRNAKPGAQYFNDILDRVGIETSAANRVEMAPYLDPARFKWVFFVDSFMFPFDNAALAARNPDEAAYMPAQTKMLRHWQERLHLRVGIFSVPEAPFTALPPETLALPHTLDGYLDFVSRSLEDSKKRGGIAVKFEASYFRSLYFADPPRAAVEAAYSKYRAGGVPEADEYTTFQDAIFRHIIVEAGRLHLPVHIHSSSGGGDYFNVRGVNVLNLENVLRDPRYLQTTFVLIHGGYPFDREAGLLAAMKNVYLDSSAMELVLYPTEFKEMLKRWLEMYPDKITFGTDAFPFGEALGVEEVYWLGVHSSRDALAAALAEMIAAHEITEARALQFAHMYLHDTAAGLYK